MKLVLLTLASLISIWAQSLDLGITEIRASVTSNDMYLADSLARKLTAGILSSIDPDQSARIRTEVYGTYGTYSKSEQFPPLENTLAEMEGLLSKKDFAGLYRKTLIFSITAKWIASHSDPLLTFQQARTRVLNEPSFMNLMNLANRAYVAKRFPDSLEAAHEALQLAQRGSGLDSGWVSIHMAQNLIGLAQFELGRHDLAAEALIQSLGNPKQSPAYPFPSFSLAERLVTANRRGVVIRYLDMVREMGFSDLKKSTLSDWIRELQAGGSPKFYPSRPK